MKIKISAESIPKTEVKNAVLKPSRRVVVLVSSAEKSLEACKSMPQRPIDTPMKVPNTPRLVRKVGAKWNLLCEIG